MKTIFCPSTVVMIKNYSIDMGEAIHLITPTNLNLMSERILGA